MKDLEININIPVGIMSGYYGIMPTLPTWTEDYVSVALQRMRRKRHKRIDKIKRMKERRDK